MATILPFKALRPREDLAENIAALPYDVYTRQEAKDEIVGKPLSFLRIDRAETTLPDEIGTYDNQVYLKAKDNLNSLKTNGDLIKDITPAFFLYELKTDEHTQTGLVGTCLVDEVTNGTIKEHEATRKQKEEDRIKHVETLQAHTGPIYLTYRNKPEITELIESLKKETPLYRFSTDDGVTHSVWKIKNKDDILTLKEKFSDIDNFYIADGHHRCASAVKVALKLREYKGSGEWDNFLSVVFPDNELKILDYNRVVKDLNGYTLEEFLDKVGETFIIEEKEAPVSPQKKGTFGMFLDGKWYLLKFKEDLPEDILDRLDVSILYDYILSPILGIGDPREDKRIDFVGGIKGLKELEKRASSDMKVAFSLYPTKLEELMAIADSKRLMPPKSTWFEPKLRSGLFIHEF